MTEWSEIIGSEIIVKFDLKKNEIGFNLLFFGIFIFSFYVRSVFLGEQLASMNLLAICGICILVFQGLYTRKIHIILKEFCFGVVLILSVLFWTVQIIYGTKSFIGSARYYFSIILPVFTIYLKVDKEPFTNIFQRFIQIIDILIAVMFLMLIGDLVLDNRVIGLFASLTHQARLQVFASSASRHASVMGHYIPTAEVYIIFYIIHALDIYIHKDREKWNIFYMFISLAGVCSTGSKGGIILLLAAFLINNITKWKYLLSGAGVILLCLVSGVFNTVFERFATTGLTTGRFEQLTLIWSRFNIIPFLGNGANSSFLLNDKVNWASAAFEFPMVMFSYEYGTIFTFFFYVAVFAVPLIILLRKKDFLNLAFLIVLDIQVNTYNGIGLGSDYFIMYAIVVFLLLNTGKLKRTAGEEQAVQSKSGTGAQTMKIGILTFQFAHNYGAMLQAYALRTYLQRVGHEVDIIPYEPDFFYKQYRVAPFVLKKNPLSMAKNFILYFKKRIQADRFNTFKNDYLDVDKKRLVDTAEVNKILDRYDWVVVGSDQVWNQNLTQNDRTYFGIDAPETVCYLSYAASMGDYKVLDDKTVELLRRFTAISVREADAAEVLKRYGIHADICIDPVFLLEEKDWRDLSHFSRSDAKKQKYILYYSLQEPQKLIDKTVELACETKLPVYMIDGKLRKRKMQGTLLTDVGPLEFLDLIDHAEYICTDSFHALAFSIIFKKKVLVAAHPKTGNRARQLLSLVNMDLKDEIIDCSKFEHDKLNAAAEESKAYLLSNITEIVR